MLRIFIRRPVLSTVISIIIVVLGIIGLTSLPIEQYPDIAPPTVRVTATYSGANADVVMNSVIIPLEEAINGVEGMTYMTSTASNSGSARITIYFEQGINPDMAAVNVQNLATQASSLLPAEVVQTGVTVQKSQTSTLLMIFLYSDNPDFDGKFIQNYANINIIPQIQRIHGVGDASAYGQQTYSMRVWLKPDVMAVYQVTSQEVVAALQDQNIEAAPGELGQNNNQTFQYTLKYTGRLKSAEEFQDIIIRSQDGQILRLKDIANVELGSLEYTVVTNFEGKEAVMIGVSQIAGSNAQQIIENVKAEIEKSKESLPEGLHYEYMVDANEFLSASIDEVWHTLIIAFILVFIVVFVFLQDLRSTLIPAIAVPVAIIGTFFFLLLFGFSINLLTLFALILAIGIVVDDAIVVVEAVHAKLDAGEKDVFAATEKAMSEIAPAIISITLVMAAVFIPVSFIGGTSGIFFRQFGLTLAIAIILSAVNALTLSPALCALFLKPDDGKEKKGIINRFYHYFNKAFTATTNKYKQLLTFVGDKKHRWIPVITVAVFACILVFLLRTIPAGFIPQEDSGSVMGMVTLPPGSSMERTDSVLQEVVKIAQQIPSVKEVGDINGLNFMSGVGSSYASVVIKMQPWADRDITTNEVVAMMTQKTAAIQNATFLFFGTPTIQGFGLGNGVSLELEDRTGGDIEKFYEITNRFLDKLKQQKEIMIASTTFNPNFPQYVMEADLPKIKEAGLTLSEIMTTLQAYIGSIYASNFNLFGKQYRVMVQAAPEYRSKLEDLNGIFVKTGTGEMAPITEYLNITPTTGPQTLYRFNMYSSMDITVIPAINASTGEAMNIIQQIANETLPTGYTFEYSGLSREEEKSSNQLITIAILCLIFVYLLLSALYESYILPFAVIFSLPVGVAGIFIFIFIGLMTGSNIVMNIYVQIALVMLIGLLSKNAILIVEYAIQRRQEGMSIVESAISGATARLRPILMTSFAFIFGLLPLAISTGAGAIGNRSIGLSAIGGMLIGTIFGVIVIPTLYIIFQSLQESLKKQKNVTTQNNSEAK
ncbi:MAG: efflux RND transporter permease subunit [Tannerella sp.]|jgi:HAE1 family hydrophobic/amphiphilic exporter-1|nr:efflux RND transporter permease subunit [Tannerella sp.]